ncbi:hypothetical protein N5079_09900 [Planotetraspora sp. A-T 1434]|uniref:hypothetical protein n=1 Tax=Planotetraspora sp. A-T 1434 TaxID=2979219 RepID=UPI0021BE26BD|nr:hypothetical protein [Planotetraspora sp. A-T 1434]MCT9930529.1 hypothetical protein [Planotetraspora sp. A-T 1434]
MRSLLRSVLGLHRMLLIFSGALTVLAVVCLVGLIVDDRTLLGAPVWLKPFKFAVSFCVYSLTLAWLLTLLSQASALAKRLGDLIACLSMVGVGLITFQAARGRQSHFNVSTSEDAAIFGLMGVLVTALWLLTIAVTGLVLLQRVGDRPTTSALRLGLVLCVMGMAEAYLMVGSTSNAGGISGAHSVGVPDGGPGLPLLGWSTTGGDLRVAHFVGLHAMQAVPLLLVGLRALSVRLPVLGDEGVRLGLVRVAGAGFGAMIVLLTWQALKGQPLIYPDSTTVAAFTALVAVVALTASAVIVAGARRVRTRPRPRLNALT